MFDRDLTQIPTETLEAEIATLYSRISAETCRWLLLVAELDRREAHLKWGCRSSAHWLVWHCGIALRAAQDQVRVARAIGELPKVRACFERGELSYSKVRALTRVATPESEAELLEVARNATAAQLERVVTAYRRALPVEALDEREERRFASLRWDDDGSLLVSARLAPEEGALFKKAFEIAADEIFRERGEDAARAEHGRRRPVRRARASGADALVRMAESARAAAGRGATGGDTHQVVVHVDADAMATAAGGGDGPARCEVEGGRGLPLETARRPSCDAGIVTSLERGGEPLSVGRKTRSIPPAVRRALRNRDRGCRFPGCTADRFIDAHHIQHWARGGETSLGNLVSLCRHHHRLVHEGGFGLETTADGGLVFRRRDGSGLPVSPSLPGTGGKLPALAFRPVSQREYHGKPLGPAAPPHGYQPLDLDLTLFCLLQRHNREVARRKRIRAGPDP